MFAMNNSLSFKGQTYVRNHVVLEMDRLEIMMVFLEIFEDLYRGPGISTIRFVIWRGGSF